MNTPSLRIMALIGALLPVSPPVLAAESGWSSYLDMNDIRGVAVGAEGIWCATRGGALLFDASSSGWGAWNRTAEGLASDSLVSVTVLESGRIGFGTEKTGISLYDPDSGLWFHETSVTWEAIANDQILFFREDPPWQLIGSRGGVMALRDDRLRVSCERFLDPCGLPSWDVSAGIFRDGFLWVGTLPGEGAEGGVARLDYGTGVWDTLNVGLPERAAGTLADVTDFAIWEDELFCATTHGVVAWTEAGWEGRSEGLVLPGRQLLDLHAGSQRLLAAASGTGGGVFAWDPAQDGWSRVGSVPLQASCVTEGADGTVWAGASPEWSGKPYLKAEEDGLWEYRDDAWIQHRHNGPHPVASYWALAVDDAGRLWAASAASGRGWRINLLDRGQWSFFDQTNTPLTNAWVFDLRVDGDQVWVGHCCCANLADPCKMNLWTPGDTTATVVDSVFNIFDSARDDRGNLWFASYFERPDEHPQVARGLYHWDRGAQRWRHYDMESTGGRLVSNAVSAVTVEGSYLWIGYASAGTSRCQLGSDGLPLLVDVAWTHYTADLPGTLTGNRVTAMASRQGEVWIGTDNGLSLRDGGTWRSFKRNPWGLPGNHVKDVALTEDGAAWIAVSGEGVTRMSRDPATGRFDIFERFGAPDLVSPEATVVAAGASGRDIWVGTTRGLSHFSPPVDLSSERFEAVSVYPNPFSPGCDVWVSFVDLPGSVARGVVVTVAGEVVHRFAGEWRGSEPRSFWDGRDLEGEIVAPGLYLVRVSTPQGWLTGQIAVLDVPCE